jgi:hypothetical protein
MRVCVPVPEQQAVASSGGPDRRAGAIGVIDNSKPKFAALAQAVLVRLERDGFTHDESLYVKKPSPTRPAEPGEIDRLSSGAVVVLVGSGD